MAGKHYIIATQTGYLVDDVTGYPYEFHSKEAAVKALAEEVKTAAQECRRRYKTCSVVGSARSGSVQINVGGRQGYNLWQRYVINERPGARKPPREARATEVHHATRKKSPVQLDRDIAQALARTRSKKFAPDDSNGAARPGRRSHSTKRSTLTAEQLAALRTFAQDNGRNWKRELNHAWSTGDWSHDYADNSGLLQQVRNTFGPSWLVKFSFNNSKTHSVKP